MLKTAPQSCLLWVELMTSGKIAFKNGEYEKAEQFFCAAVKEASTPFCRRIILSKALHWWGVTCQLQGREEEASFLFRLTQSSGRSFQVERRGEKFP